MLPVATLLAALLAGSPARSGNGLAVDPADPRLAARPELKARIAASAHGYFRFVNTAFALETCEAFADVVDEFPDVNLHGDAHVEQYTVTNLGQGLSDFDDCTEGKPIIDLVRFGTSLVLAARERGWGDEERAILSKFLKGYEDALKNPNRLTTRPDLGWEIRKGFGWDHAAALRQAHEIIDGAPLPPDSFAQTAAEFSVLIRFRRDDLPPHFFDVKKVGALRMGVGSALDEKYLLLFEGPTEADDDDLIVEAKQIRDLSGNPCLRTDVGASRILSGEELIAYEPFRYSAVVPRGDKFFWIHDWTDDYQEASIADVLRTPDDLKDIAYDAGLQLGRAHPKRPDRSPDKDRQRAIRRAVKKYETRIRATVFALAKETEAAWRTFNEAAGRLPND
ncbi:MAG: DUF2252 domain-containing protein [Acidobacteria bacterium]|nr:DUF2252 domain-containing protein [Acidobacteriota bacterium]